MDAKTYKRLFLAIPPQRELINECLEAQSKLPQIKEIRPVKEQNLHITVLFLGNVLNADLPELTKKAREIISSSPAFNLDKKEFCFMPSDKKPRMLWMAFHKNPFFTDLHQKLKQGLEDFFDSNENLDPIFHITLARIKPGIMVGNIQAPLNFDPLVVKQVELWESQTLAAGAEYTALQYYNLNQP